MKKNILDGIEILSSKEERALIGAISLGKADGKSVNEIITERIIQLIEKSDLPPWRMPWKKMEIDNESVSGMNFKTKKPYTGANYFMTAMAISFERYSSPFFLTFKQLEEMGGKLKKGAASIPIVYYTPLYRDGKKTITQPVYDALPESQKANYEKSFALKYYNVFNADLIEGIAFPVVTAPVKAEIEKIESCETILKNAPNMPPVRFGGDQAFYVPSQDRIQMPFPQAFDYLPEFYSTLYHEMIHATGSPNRLDREEKKKRKNWGDSYYAFEELIAEMGANYLCAESGILYHTIKNSAPYIKSWKQKVTNELKDDPNFFLKACADAQKGADYILGRLEKSIYDKFKDESGNRPTLKILYNQVKEQTDGQSPKAAQTASAQQQRIRILKLKYKYA